MPEMISTMRAFDLALSSVQTARATMLRIKASVPQQNAKITSTTVEVSANRLSRPESGSFLRMDG